MRIAHKEVGAAVLLVCLMTGIAAAQSPNANQAAPGQNQIQTEELSPQAQQELAQKVIRAIVMLPYYGVFDNIGFSLHGRTVTLTGQVLTATLKPDAEHAVKKVEGVDKVINKIEVLPPGPIDMRIREQVRQAIYGYGPLFKYANMPNPPIR